MNDGYPVNPPYSRAGLLAKLTGAATLAAGALLYGQATSQLSTLTLGTAGRVLVAGASAPAWSDAGLSYASGVLAIAGSAPGMPSAGQVLIGGGAIKAGGAISCTALTANGLLRADGGIQSYVGASDSVTMGSNILLVDSFASPAKGCGIQLGASNTFDFWCYASSAWTRKLSINCATGAATFASSASCTTLTATAGSISVGNYGSVFIADSTDTVSDIRIGIRPGASTTLAGLRFACNSASAAVIDGCTFTAGGGYSAAKPIALNGSGGGLIIGAYALAGSEAMRVAGGSAPGTPGSTDVLIGAGAIKAGAGISCATLSSFGRATVDDVKLGDGSTYIGYLSYGSSFFNLTAFSNHGIRLLTNNTLAATLEVGGAFTTVGKLSANSAAASSTLTGNTVAQVITWLQTIFA